MIPLLATVLALCIQAPPAAPEQLHGVVRVPDGGAKSVTVGLHTAFGDAFRQRFDGFAQRSAARATTTATVQADGRFQIWIPSKGAWYLRAEVPGFAPCEVGPLELDPKTPPAPVELTPVLAGRLAGRIAPEKEGQSVAGLVVCASRGDGRLLSARTDARGEFRFDGLMPGAWHVRLEREPVTDRSGPLETAQVASPEIPSNVAVRSGETARFDVDLARRPRLALRLAFGAAPAAGWRATLRGPGLSPMIDQVDLDAAGAARLDGEQAGAYTLVLAGKLGAAELRLEQALELGPAELRWEQALALGSLTGYRADTKVASIRLTHAGEGGLRITTNVTPDAQGLFALASLPVGEWRLAHAVLGSQSELGRARVEAGKEAWIELP